VKRAYLFGAAILGAGIAIFYLAQGMTPPDTSLTPSSFSPSDWLISAQSAVQGVLGTISGGILTAQQIAALAIQAGFTGDDAATATAIALAESSGKTGAVGDLTITPGGSIGLWQINLKYHPEYTRDQLLDPQTNANAAFAIYSAAGGFTPWSTYKGGQYQAHLDDASTAIAGLSS
jgi:hypothetical protein